MVALNENIESSRYMGRNKDSDPEQVMCVLGDEYSDNENAPTLNCIPIIDKYRYTLQ